MEKETYPTNTPIQNKITLQKTDESFPKQKYVAGESVNEHKNLEDANSFVSEKEIGQQNENL
jgi:hypothetical protein